MQEGQEEPGEGPLGESQGRARRRARRSQGAVMEFQKAQGRARRRASTACYASRPPSWPFPGLPEHSASDELCFTRYFFMIGAL